MGDRCYPRKPSGVSDTDARGGVAWVGAESASTDQMTS